MERKLLSPEQIIVPGEYELGNDRILEIYFRLFDKGYAAAVPPVIVARKDLIISEEQRKERLEEEIRIAAEEGLLNEIVFLPYALGHRTAMCATNILRELYGKFNEKTKGAEYYLIDGNHRTAAAELTHNPISALEVSSDEDLEAVRRMASDGEVFGFERSEKSVRELVKGFEEYLFDHIEDARTVKKRIDMLVSEGDLPKYMADRYRKGPEKTRQMSRKIADS